MTVTDADRKASLAVGSLGRETTQTFLRTTDQGERWVFSFRYGGIDGGELVLSQTELEEAGRRPSGQRRPVPHRDHPHGQSRRTKAYVPPRAEGKSTGEIARIVKRYVARQVYKHLPHPC